MPTFSVDFPDDDPAADDAVAPTGAAATAKAAKGRAKRARKRNQNRSRPGGGGLLCFLLVMLAGLTLGTGLLTGDRSAPEIVAGLLRIPRSPDHRRFPGASRQRLLAGGPGHAGGCRDGRPWRWTGGPSALARDGSEDAGEARRHPVRSREPRDLAATKPCRAIPIWLGDRSPTCSGTTTCSRPSSCGTSTSRVSCIASKRRWPTSDRRARRATGRTPPPAAWPTRCCGSSSPARRPAARPSKRSRGWRSKARTW